MLRCALVLVAAVAVTAADPPPALTDIFVSDCNGGVHFLPGHPLEFNLNFRMAKRLADAFAHTIIGAANCTTKGTTCSSIPESDSIMHFLPSLSAVLNYLGGSGRSKLADACASLFSRSFGDTSIIDRLLHVGELYASESPFQISGLFNAAPLPSTCNLASLLAGKGCSMEFDLSAGTSAGIKLQIAADSCPRSAGPNGVSLPSVWPYISVSCSGKGCAHLFAPCAGIGSGSECGGSTLGYTCQDPLSLLDFKPSTTVAQGAGGRWQGLMADIMKAVKLISETTDLDGCGDTTSGTKNGRAELVRRFRDAAMTAMGRPLPAAGSIPDADVAVGFCMPTKDTFDSIGKKLRAPADSGLLRASYPDLPNSPLTAAEKACFDKGCRPAFVGDGKCDFACFNPECLWDGNDCGAPRAKAGDLPSLAESYDGSSADIYSEGYCVAPASMAANGTNTLQPCNGMRQSRYYYLADGAATYTVNTTREIKPWQGYCNYYYSYNSYYYSSTPPCTCNCPLKAGAKDSGRYCENCLPVPALAGQYDDKGVLKMPDTSAYSGLLLKRGKIDSLEPLVTAWSGTFASGASALSAERKSGISFRTPPTTLDPATSPGAEALAGGLAPVLQLSCTGEVTLSFGSPALGISASVPRVMEMAALVHQMGHFAVNCRIKSQSQQLGTASPLSRAQFLLRYGLHQLASWFYQFTSFGAPRIETTGSSLPAAILSALGGGPAGTRFGPINNLPDYLFITREPAFTATQPDEKAALPTSSWGTSFRMMAPHATECSLASLLDPGKRRCRFTWNGLSSLLARAAGPGASVTARIHVDVRNDVCAGSPKGGMPGAAALTDDDAAYAGPAGAIWIESPTLVGAASQLRFCRDDTQCASLPGTVCTDLESNLGDWVNNLDRKRRNPLSVWLYGRSPGGHRTAPALACGSTVGHLRMWSRFMLSTLVGRQLPTELTGSDAGSIALKMCVPKLSAIGDALSPWTDSIFTPGDTCTKGGSCLPVAGSAPATVGGFAAPVHDALYPPPSAAGTARAVVAPVPKTAVTIAILLPTLTLDSFTNAVKARLLAAIVESLASRGLVVPVSAVFLTAVEESSAEISTSALSGSGTQRRALQTAGTTRTSAVAVRVSVDTTQATLTPGSPAALSGGTVTSALSTELTSGSAGTVSATIGAVLSTAGVIPAGASSAAVTKPNSWTAPPPLGASSQSSGNTSVGAIVGGILGGLILVGAIGAAVFFLVVKPRRANSVKQVSGTASAKQAAASSAPPQVRLSLAKPQAKASAAQMTVLFALENPMQGAIGRKSEAPTPVVA